MTGGVMTRRGFAQSVVVSAALAPFAARASEPSSADQSDGMATPLRLVRRTIEIGLPRPFSVLHVSDTHLTRLSPEDRALMDEKGADWCTRRAKTFAGGASALSAAVSYAKRLRLPLFHTGDLVDFASRANLSAIGAEMSGADWFASCGNHEFRGWHGVAPPLEYGTSREERDRARAAFAQFVPNEISVSSRVVGGINFVQYDNGGFSDYLGAAQFEAVRREFAKGLPVVLLCHMPFYTEELCAALLKNDPSLSAERIGAAYVQGRPDKPNWAGRLEMSRWLRDQPLLKAVLCGHLHFEFTSVFSRTANQYVADANYRGTAYRYDFT